MSLGGRFTAFIAATGQAFAQEKKPAPMKIKAIFQRPPPAPSTDEALQSATSAQRPAVAQQLKPKISFGKRRKPDAAEAEQAPRKRISVTLSGALSLLVQSLPYQAGVLW